mmetsp:Transcript_19021/g.48586  ORF Transcript_19021/g.48586 Transcript_19021/m.48586 type:complete len:113 (+) Transcript_19021:145-483(+)
MPKVTTAQPHIRDALPVVYRKEKDRVGKKEERLDVHERVICKKEESKPSKSHAENVLREFDNNRRYGPSVGLSRLARWERAEELGLSPLSDIPALLELYPDEERSVYDKLVN